MFAVHTLIVIGNMSNSNEPTTDLGGLDKRPADPPGNVTKTHESFVVGIAIARRNLGVNTGIRFRPNPTEGLNTISITVDDVGDNETDTITEVAGLVGGHDIT